MKKVRSVATTRYNSSIGWVYDRQIFTVGESKLFHQKISEINRGSKAFVKSADGEYMLPVANKIVFTDGDYSYPQISKIIEVVTEYEDSCEELKGCILDVEKRLGSENRLSLQAFSIILEEGVILSYTRQTGRIYDWTTGKNKGTNLRKVIENYRKQQERRRNAEESESGTELNNNEADSNEPAFSMSENKFSQRNISKTVQIDNNVFDLIINVKKRYKDKSGYTYTIKILDNKKMKASPVKTDKQSSIGQAKPSDNIIRTSEEKSQDKNSSRNTLSEAALLNDEMEAREKERMVADAISTGENCFSAASL